MTASVVGADQSEHQSALRTALAPGWVASAGVFVVLGLRDGSDASFDSTAVQQSIESQFSVSPIAILPLLVVLVLSARTTGFLSLLAGAVTADDSYGREPAALPERRTSV